jgi:hypothetical protein
MTKLNTSTTNPARRAFLSKAANIAAGGTVLALATIPPAAATAPASALDPTKASPALREAANALADADEVLKAAKARFTADDAKVSEWEIANPEPKGKRAIKKWRRKWLENRDAVCEDSWQAQLEAEDRFRDAQMAVAKIKPRDMDELALKGCLSGVYDPVRLACGSNAVIGYSVAWDLVKLTMPAQS